MPDRMPLNRTVEPSPTNPHSWFPLIGHEPDETQPGGFRVMWGVMRPEYRDFRPSLSTFVQMKLAPAAGEHAPWTISTYRHKVLLPAGAADHLRDARILVEMSEREQPMNAKALASYVTLTSSPQTLHGQFETARAVGQELTRRFGVAVLLVQHVPSMNGGSSQPHVHIVVPGPRALTSWSTFGRAVSELAGDKGRALIMEMLGEIAATNDGR